MNDGLLRVGFERGKGLASNLIAYRGGRFSHMFGVLPDGRRLDSRADWIKVLGKKAIPPGVQIRPWPDKSTLAASITLELKVPHRIQDAVYDAAISQIGRPYDQSSILDFILGRARERDFRDPRAWFCDELWIWAFEKGGALPYLVLPPNRIDPTGAALVCSAMGFTSA